MCEFYFIYIFSWLIFLLSFIYANKFDTDVSHIIVDHKGNSVIALIDSMDLDNIYYKTKIDNRADMETSKLVTISEFLSPIILPKNPEIIDAIKGRNKIEISILPF